jgi:outer membrane protein assembly factor BamB
MRCSISANSRKYSVRLVAVLLFLGLVILGRSLYASDWPTYMRDGRRSGVVDDPIELPLTEAWTFEAKHAPARSTEESARHNFWHRRHYLGPRSVYDRAFHVVGSGEQVYFASSSEDAVFCFDALSGKVLWTFFAEGPIRNAPIIEGERLLFGSDDGKAYCLDAKTGDLLWAYNPSRNETNDANETGLVIGDERMISRRPIRTGVAVTEGVAYFGAGLFPTSEGVYLCAVDVETGDEVWKKSVNQPAQGYLTVSEQWIVLPTGRTSPNVYDRTTGALLGQVKNERGNGGTFAVVSDRQAFSGPGPEGRIYGVDLEKKEQIAIFQGERLVVNQGKAYVLGEGLLTAIDWERFLAEREQGTTVDACRLWEQETSDSRAMVASSNLLFLGGDERVAARRLNDGAEVWSAPIDGLAYGLALIEGRLIVSTDQGRIHVFETSATAPSLRLSVGNATNNSTQPTNTQPSLTLQTGLDADAPTLRLDFHSNRLESTTAITGQISVASDHECVFTSDKTLDGLQLDGATMLTVPADQAAELLPTESFTAEAWVRIDQTLDWGSMIGAIQDNGNYERGWLLGYRGDRFCLGVASENTGSLTYMTSPSAYRTGQWSHVVGVYDGTKMRLYVNGRLEVESDAQSGPILYPENGRLTFTVGAYHDDNEKYPMTGLLHRVALFDRPLDAATIRERFAQYADRLPQPPLFLASPILRFEFDEEAEIEWACDPDVRTFVQWGEQPDALDQTTEPTLINHYSIARLTDLKPGATYYYQVIVDRGTGLAKDVVRSFRALTASESTSPYPENVELAKTAERSLLQAGVEQGWCLVPNSGDGQFLYELAKRSNLTILGLESDPETARRSRDLLQESGLYGRRVTVLTGDLESIQLPPYFANLVLCDPRKEIDFNVALQEFETANVIRPSGGTFIQGDVEHVRPALPGAGEWTHNMADPANTACSDDELTTGPLQLLWFGQPGARQMADRHHRNPSPLYADGRLFTPGDQVVFAQDAYNGTLLWKRTVSDSRRLGVFLDAGNMALGEDSLHYVVEDRCLRFDVESGEESEPLTIPEEATLLTDAPRNWGYLAVLDDAILGTTVRTGASYEEMSWDGDSALWYDSMSLIAGESLFALDPVTGDPQWTYKSGLILHTTIAVGPACVYFIESTTSPEDFQGRAPMPFFKQSDCYLTALSLDSGEVVYRNPIDLTNCHLIAYVSYAQGKLVVSGNRYVDGRLWYWIYGLNADDGEQVWEISENTGFGPNGGHGEQNRHPTIVDDVVYGHPYRYALHSGEQIEGWRFNRAGHGCGNVAASKGSLFYRGGNPQQCDLERGVVESVNSVSRPGCWINMIPAGGLLMVPEASSGCTCDFPLQMSVVYFPSTPDQ